MDYKEKLRLAKEALESGSYDKNTIEYVFPELKESEDERMRYFISNELACLRATDEKDTIRYNELTEAIAWLEKQCEQEETICDKCKKEHPSHSCQDITALGRCAIEHEHKSTDKVEPKFHKGEWVVHNVANFVFQIVGVGTCGYSVVNREGQAKTISFSNEGNYHLWTIQDAKNGDVLATNSWLYMYETNNNKAIIQFHCTCPINGKPHKWCFSPYYSYLDIYTDANIHPATKEQRNILFQKMKEAGYEWNAKKKKLKKIEIITPLFNVGDTIVKKRNSDINKFGQFIITDIAYGKYWYNSKIICDITEQNEWELVVQKFVKWNEEDEDMFKSLEVLLNNASCYSCTEGVDKILSWLKSIKDRIQPQPKQEWNEEDERLFGCLIKDQEEFLNDVYNDKYGHSEIISDLKDMYHERIDWLKSLKDRIKGE